MEEKCVFCKILNNKIPSNVVYENDHFKVILDNAPATKGHAILIPKEHFEDIYGMDDITASKLFPAVLKVAKAMKKVLNCAGLNLLQNNGHVAGQTVFHFHMHLIPRYEEDGVEFKWKNCNYEDGEANKIAQEIRKELE